MSGLRMDLGLVPAKTSFQRGREDGLAGKPAPALPRFDTPWSERLYASGWSRGADERNQRATPGLPESIAHREAH